MAKQSSVRFRSKYERYRWKHVKFENNIAIVTHAGTIEAMENDPYFGEGRDFWIDADVATVESAANAGGDDITSKKTPAKGGSKAAAKDTK